MAEFRFGDLVCYRYIGPYSHDEPLMYVGPCGHVAGHAREGLIDIFDPRNTYRRRIDHKTAEMWQVCHHFTELNV